MDELFKDLSVTQDTDESKAANAHRDPQKSFPILELPREIQLDIFEQCQPRTLKSLRLANSHFKNTTASILFRKWTLSISFYTPIHDRPDMSRGPFTGGGNRWLDRRDNYIGKKSKIPAKTQIKALQDAHENGSDELQMLYDNVQEISIEKYDLFEGFPDQSAMDARWPRYSDLGVQMLKGFLGRMKRLRSLHWRMSPYNLDAAMTSPSLAANITHLSVTRVPIIYFIVKAPEKPLTGFTSLTNVTHLDLKLSSVSDLIGFNNLPNLTNLTLESTTKACNIATFLAAQTVPFKLRSLTLRNDTRGVNFPDEVFQKYMSALQSLHLVTPEVEIERTDPDQTESRDPFDGDTKSIWTHLMENEIYPSSISTFGQSPSLLKYLLSYPQPNSVLKSLEVRVWPYMTIDPEDPRNFVNTLWHQVVPFHKKTLKRIAIYPEAHSVTRGGNYLDKISWDDQTALEEQLSEFPTPETGLCMLDDEIKKVLKSCEKLEALEMGSLNWNGTPEFLRFVLFELSRKVRDVGFYLGGWSRKLVGWDCVGSSGAHYARQFAEARFPLMEEVWNHTPEDPESAEILNDWTWKRLNIKLIPLKKTMWFVGGGVGGKWKLMDKKLEREICSSMNETERGWGSVYDVLGGESGVGYDTEVIFGDAVFNNRYDPVLENEKQAAVFEMYRRAAENCGIKQPT
ncbi:hypothetical protein TWF506_011248 [Arthrobotrys conoides]|uniref:F-box domain-containing protein n=1 Tax=Arthrobotrys conoides TaxID=74498 RepID=A0AAN8NE69_9PEZI